MAVDVEGDTPGLGVVTGTLPALSVAFDEAGGRVDADGYGGDDDRAAERDSAIDGLGGTGGEPYGRVGLLDGAGADGDAIERRAEAPDQVTFSSVQRRRRSSTDSASISAECSWSWPNWA